MHLRRISHGISMEAIEPDAELVRRFGETLRGWYNAPSNAVMMDGSTTLSFGDVIAFWRTLREGGGRGFLAFADGELVGDADLRGIDRGVAEFALMIGDDARKGRGLGRALALIVHVFGFRELGLARIYVPPRKDNARVHALNDFLGYERDDSPDAARFADGDASETYSLGADRFRALHAEAWQTVEVIR